MAGAGWYLSGVLCTAATVSGPIIAALALRRRLLPAWAAAPARLAEVVLGMAVLLVVAEVLGVVGAFDRVAVAAMELASGVAIAAWSHRTPAPSIGARSTRAVPRPSRMLTSAAALAILAVVVEWSARTAVAYRHGIIDIDSRRYHLPIAAAFVQAGRITGFHFTELDPTIVLHPDNAELLQALAILPFHDDVLSPVVNLGWLVVALLAAWTAGRAVAAAALGVLAVAPLLGSSLLSKTEPGAATNDIMVLALLLAAAAILLQPDGRQRASMTVAALAAGLALGTKLDALAPVAVLGIGSVMLAARGQRLGTAAVWAGGAVAGAGLWFGRDLIRTGSPLPDLSIGIGPLHLPHPPTPSLDALGQTLLDYRGDAHFWTSTVPDGLQAVLGPAWPLLLGAGVVGVVGALLAGDAVRRLLGAAALLSALAYVVTPNSAGGGPGTPWLFAVDVRFLTPALALGLVLLPFVLPRRFDRLSGAGLLGLLGVTMAGRSGVWSAFPDEPRAVVDAGAAVGAALAVLIAARRRPRLAGAVAVAGLVAAGLPGRAAYLEHRYRDGSTEWPVLDRIAQDSRGARIGVAAFTEAYPLYGPDLSNRVELVARTDGADVEPITDCRTWRAALLTGGFDTVVTGDLTSGVPGAVPDPGWTTGAGGAEVRLRDGSATLYRLLRPPDPGGC